MVKYAIWHGGKNRDVTLWRLYMFSVNYLRLAQGGKG